jgi:APA family basic amino acid/polyamine antiporter
MPAGLKRTLSFTELAFYGVGIIVGAGIYAVIGAAAAEAKEALWLSFLIAAFVALITAASYAELASMFPSAGAEYQFLRKAFPKVRALAFLAGSLLSINTAATVATVSLAFGGYLAVYVAAPVIVAAFGLVVATTALNVAGIREATWASIALIVIEVGALVLFAGAAAGGEKHGAALATLPEAGEWAGVFSGAALIFFAYIGFEDIANLSEEAKKPRRNVPRALFFSVIATGILYLAVALGALAVVTPDQLAASQSPLHDAAGKIAPWLGQVLAVAALFATASTALISLIGSSRMLYGMARGGDMPRALGKTLSKRRTPWIAALVMAAVSCVLLPLGEVKIAASVSSITILLIFIGVQAALIGLRFTAPRQRRTFRVPLEIAKVPVIPALGILCCVGLLTQFEALAYAVSGGLIAAVAVAYFVRERSAR